MRRVGRWMAVVLGAAGLAGAAERPVEFNRDVRPILSDRCFSCHGPSKQSGKLRLDLRDAALEQEAFRPGAPDESALLERVASDDPEFRMPPPASKLEPLTPAEIDVLRHWIKSGAEYQPHWAFLSLEPVVLPDGGPASIDALLIPRLAERGLALQPEADRGTLLRRVTFDLTGLPPTPQQLAEFLADASPEAYEKVVDRLLASEQYGERMAVDWLDASRYADSYGFQVDREREMWPWRDWVIRAFNSNLPFDQFLTQQLAGDLLPDATDDQILATAFNRLHQQEAEGGSVEEEYRVEYVCDRVQTFSTAFLGLSFECARCHDHKFDPIKQTEYYQLFAMFQNIDEAGLYSFFTPSAPTPALLMKDGAAQTRQAELTQEIERLTKSAGELKLARRGAFETWLASRPDKVEPAGELARFSFDALDGNKLANSVKADQPALLRGENRLVPGWRGQAIEFTGDDPVDLPLGNFHAYEPFSLALSIQTPDVKERAVVLHRSRAWTDAASRGYELLIADGKLRWSLIHFWPGDAVSIETRDPLPLNEWVRVVVTSDGSGTAAGLKLSLNGAPAATTVVRDRLTKDITGGGGDNIALGERFRDRGFKGGAIDELRVFGRALTPFEIRALDAPDAVAQLLTTPAADLQARDRETLFAWYLATADAEWAQHLAALQQARAARSQFLDGLREIMVMRELPEPKPAYVLFRGEYNERRDEVHAGTPAALSPFPDDAPRNRLGLARWLTDRRHPLTARVAVNRLWQGLFGRGLVKTSEDFGSQGSRPLYPELLDWLALRYIDTGWDTKALLKTIVQSRTYRQRSSADPQTLADDPDNEWLARGPRFRLPAEMIRDNALAASGLLQQRVGGPPVAPYELSEAFKPSAPSGGDGVYRRSLYTQWKRTGPPPALVAFDAPRRAVCIARRERTDSPLQALILLNGVQYVEAARVLGEKLHRDAAGDVGRMIERGFQHCLSRHPTPREVAIATQLYAEQLDEFTKNPDAAAKLLAAGRAPRDASIPAPAAAAAMILAQTLLNHDACVVKR